ncbi:hypothetical protein LshimejAT787_0504500 [Lyophyllum shimeji]|uniref:Uncharacterized protein n=1 Tax=Lyophyllum shimeji TaxID=47721 RepID=A0A9P3PMF2_LYOSH|nr:hypothetical protein LshimejAT787_0504500 [Lyophyllum shimeji]
MNHNGHTPRANAPVVTKLSFRGRGSGRPFRAVFLYCCFEVLDDIRRGLNPRYPSSHIGSFWYGDAPARL